MKNSLITAMIALTLSSGLGRMAAGQATPAATANAPAYNPGPSLPTIDGNFQYSLTAAEAVQRGGVGNYTSTDFSGNVEYVSKSPTVPFNLLYSAGVLISTLAGQGTQTFQSLTVSQGLVTGQWNFGISDSVSYLPQSPTTGLAGIPGQGNQGLLPTPNPTVPAQSVLTTYGKRVSNTVNGDIQRLLNGRTSITGSADYSILRFVDGNGLDSSEIDGRVGVNRKIDARSGASLGVQYGEYTFTGGTNFNTRGLNVGYTRQWSRSLTMDATVGPQWISSYQGQSLLSPTSGTFLVPARLDLAANIGFAYTWGFSAATLDYTRGINSGSGVQTGGQADTLTAQVQHSYGRDWALSGSGSYIRTAGLGVTGTTTGFYGGAQLTRRLTPSFSAFVAVTALEQSVSNAAAPNILSGISQVYSIGITYSPHSLRLGQF